MFKMMNLTLIVPIARCKWFAIKNSIKSSMLNLMFDAYYFCCHIGRIKQKQKLKNQIQTSQQKHP